jgi:hypothetical protein
VAIFFSTAALIVSLISFLITIWLWRESNRPVVTARIRTHKGGNISILYRIELVNSGTRPAKNVRLHVDHQEITAALLPAAQSHQNYERELRCIERCFEDRAIVPILLNGGTETSPFGHTSIESPFWLPGATLRVAISYQGLEGQSYRSNVTIKIDDTAGFAGFSYGSPGDA